MPIIAKDSVSKNQEYNKQHAKNGFRKYYKSFIESQQYLVRTLTCAYPIDINTLIKSTEKDIGEKIVLTTVSDYHRFVGGDLAKHYVKDGKTVYHASLKTYMLIYNEEQYALRNRFTILHELAHIVLGHLKDERTEISRGGISDWLYYKLEGEANAFAGGALAPPILIKELLYNQPYSADLISKKFQVSPEAAQNRRKDIYIEWLKTEPLPPEHAVYHLGKESINISFCPNCSSMNNLQALFCPICKHENSRVFTGETNMIYSSIELDENSKAIQCPTCKNEKLEIGDYCPICGNHIVNKCAGDNIETDMNGNPYSECGELLQGNARYCHKCGSKSTFLENNILRAWEDDSLPF